MARGVLSRRGGSGGTLASLTAAAQLAAQFLDDFRAQLPVARRVTALNTRRRGGGFGAVAVGLAKGVALAGWGMRLQELCALGLRHGS